MDLRLVGIAAALGSAASWAVGSVLFQRLGEHLSPLAMTLAKGIVSVVLLALAVLLNGYEKINQTDLLLLIFSGLLGIALGDTFFFQALQDLGAHALVILGMFGQVLTVFLAVLFLGENPTPTQWTGIVFVILGVSAVLFSKIVQEKTDSRLKGILFGLASVMCMSVSLIIAKEGLESVSTIQATLVRMLSGTTGMLFFGMATQKIRRWMLPFQNWRLVLSFLISVCVITFGGFWLSLVAIKYVDVAIAHTLNSTEPLFVLPLAVIFLKEKITLRAILGTIVTTTGVVFLCVG